MAKVYSLDLRKKVMGYLDSSHTMEETKGIFRIDRKTIYRWKRRKKENKLEAG